MDRGARRATVHGVAKSWAWLSDTTAATSVCTMANIHTSFKVQKKSIKVKGQMRSILFCLDFLKPKPLKQETPDVMFYKSTSCLLPLQYFWTPLVAQLVKDLPAMWEISGFDPWVGKIPWRRERLPAPVFWPGEFHGLYSPWGSQRVEHNWVTFTFTIRQIYGSVSTFLWHKFSKNYCFIFFPFLLFSCHLLYSSIDYALINLEHALKWHMLNFYGPLRASWIVSFYKLEK